MKKYSINMVGCDRAKDYLISALSAGRLYHAYIIEGAEGSGKHRLLNELLKAMGCGSDNAPCGVCGNCIKLDAGVCTDIYKIKTPPDRSVITVDQIRAIYDTVGLTPNDLEFKAYVIEDGQKMNASAQNAFLKLFEEPPANVYFFILTTDAQSLLPTVRSRAVILRTERLSYWQMCEVLDGLGIKDDAKRKKAITAANGCPGEAVRIYNGDGDEIRLRAISDKLISSLLSPGSDKLNFITAHHKNIKKLEEQRAVYAQLQCAIRDILVNRTGAGGEYTYFTDQDELEEYSIVISDKAAVKINGIIGELLSTYDVPLNPVVAMTSYASRIWDAHLL